MGKVHPVFFVPNVRLNTRLVGARIDDGFHQVAEIEVMGDEIFRQSLQQGLVHWRIRGANIIYRLDDAATQEVAPDAIRNRACEEWVVLRGQPLDQRLTPLGIAWNRWSAKARHQIFGRNRTTGL